MNYTNDSQLDFGITLLRLLSEHESTVVTLADRLGQPLPLMDSWLRGSILPTSVDVERIAEILNLSSAERDELRDSLFSTSLARVTASGWGGERTITPRRSSADLFGTFLESLQRRQADRHQRETRHYPGEARLLAHLREAGPRSVSDLLGSSQLRLFEFTALVERMQANGLITVEGEPGKEQVRLTATGQQAAGVAR